MLSLLVGLLLLVLLLLAVPLHLGFRVHREHALEGYLRVRWGFGLLRFEQPISDSGDDVTEAPVPRKPQHSRQRDDTGQFLRALRSAPFRQRLLRLLGDLWRAIDKRGLRLYLRIGLDDPADTGQLWALLGPLSGLLYAQHEAELCIEPEFLQACLEFDAEGELRLIPLQLIAILVTAWFSPSLRHGLRPSRI